VRVIDLSADFRIKDPAVYKEFYGSDHPAPELLARSVYGIPELYREPLRTAELVASAGCYPTSIILPLHPLLKARLLDPASITVTSLSGVSGAGRTVSEDYLYVECNGNARPYGVPKTPAPGRDRAGAGHCGGRKKSSSVLRRISSR